MRSPGFGIVIVAVTSSWAAAQPAIELDATKVSAAGLTPGGQVLWLGATRGMDGWVPTLRRVCALGAADSSGQATLDLGHQVPVKSILVVVDISTAAFAAATPPDYPNVVGIPFPSGGLTYDKAGAATTIKVEGESLDLAVVRPGVGAWHGRAVDGGATDLDGQRDGVLEVTIAGLHGLSNAPGALDGAREGDVVLGLDWVRMHVFAGKLPQGER